MSGGNSSSSGKRAGGKISKGEQFQQAMRDARSNLRSAGYDRSDRLPEPPSLGSATRLYYTQQENAFEGKTVDFGNAKDTTLKKIYKNAEHGFLQSQKRMAYSDIDDMQAVKDFRKSSNGYSRMMKAAKNSKNWK